MGSKVSTSLVLSVASVATGGVIGGLMVFYRVVEYGVVVDMMTAMGTAVIAVKQYFPTPVDQMKVKPWKVVVGLREGYDTDAKVHIHEEVEEVFRAWMHERVFVENLPVLSGMVGPVEHLLYPYRNGGTGRIISEECIVIHGDLTVSYDKRRDDAEVLRTVRSLAAAFHVPIQQGRIYFDYDGTQYRSDAVKPSV